MKLAIFGPPGIGKSSIISKLHSDGLDSFDLESIWPKFKPSDHLIVGAAGHSVQLLRSAGYKCCLLYLPQSSYEKRRLIRDKAIPKKASQYKHQISDWFKADWDYVLRADDHISKVIKSLSEI